MISLTESNITIIRSVQALCADIASRDDDNWSEDEAEQVALIFTRAEKPRDLFKFVDEMTGHWVVGYQTTDGREWFHILRQMRNRSKGFGEVLWGPRPPRIIEPGLGLARQGKARRGTPGQG